MNQRWKVALAVVVAGVTLWVSPAPVSAVGTGSTFTVDQSSANATTALLCALTTPSSCVFDANVFNFRYQSQVDQQIAGALGAHRFAKGEALRIFTSELVKLDGIGICLGAFRHDFHAEIVCQRDNRA